jgi:hypothetical protein
MESEMSAAAGKERHDSSITPRTTPFVCSMKTTLITIIFVVGRFQGNDKHLFEGKIWMMQ